MTTPNDNLYPVFHEILSRDEKEALLDQRSTVIWLTGLSGAGKTTLAKYLEEQLFSRGYLTQILDGDNIHDPAPDLKFRLYYCLQMYFANGGGPCYIVSCGTYTTYDPTTAKKALNDALDALRKEDEPTMIIFCDAAKLSETDQY